MRCTFRPSRQGEKGPSFLPQIKFAYNDGHVLRQQESFWRDFAITRYAGLRVNTLSEMITRAILRGEIKPLEKIPESRLLRSFFSHCGKPVSAQTIESAMQETANRGLIFYLNGRGLNKWGRGYYVFDLPKVSFPELVEQPNLGPIPQKLLLGIFRRDLFKGRLRNLRVLPAAPDLKKMLGVGSPCGERHFVRELLTEGLIVAGEKKGRKPLFQINPPENTRALIGEKLIRDFWEMWPAGFNMAFFPHVLTLAQKPPSDLISIAEPQQDFGNRLALADLALDPLVKNPITFHLLNAHFIRLITTREDLAFQVLPIFRSILGQFMHPNHSSFARSIEWLCRRGFFISRGSKTATRYAIAPQGHWISHMAFALATWISVPEKWGYPRQVVLDALETIKIRGEQ